MNGTPATGPPTPDDRALERQLREVNEALVVSSVRQHELAEQAQKAEVAARASQAGFEALFDASPIGMYMVDGRLRIRQISSKAREVFGDAGAEGVELIGRDFAEVIHVLWPPELADAVLGRFRHTLETGEPYLPTVLSADRHDRHVREHYEWQLHRIALPDGQYGVVCSFMDISARLLAERTLRDSELRYRRLFQAGQDGVLILDADTGKVLDANTFMCALTGRELGELLGKELHEIGMFNDIEENKEAFRELQRTGYLRHDHLPVKNRRGEKVEVEFIANVYHEGERLVAQCNVRDIAERNRLEREIARQAGVLAAQSRGKDEFLAMLSHELRNPLAPIRAAVHLLRLQEGGKGTPIQQKAREIIERQVANLTTMISDLSEVSRVVSGRIRLVLEPVDLKQIVEHARQTVAPLFDQRRHAVSITFCAEPVWVQADSTRLEEVLVNLLNNAAKYTPDGGRIEVSCERGLEGGTHHALARVSDNGVGIDHELLPRIFDLFTQADRSLERSAGGLGIGLSLAQRLVALHGGNIWAYSRGPGLGSEFTVKLPLIAAPLSDPQAQVQTPTAPAPAHPGQEPVRVLVVDDNVDLVTMIAGALRYKGYRVQTAYTGPEALKLAREWRPDIALLDIGLPGLDGYEVARRIRADAVRHMAGGDESEGTARARMRLIAITGYGLDSDIALAKEAGFDGHLVKPCDLDELEQMMTSPVT